MNPGPEHPFERKFVDGTDRRLIESKCALCGFRIVGSAAGSLKDDEGGHVRTCPKKKSKDTAAS